VPLAIADIGESSHANAPPAKNGARGLRKDSRSAATNGTRLFVNPPGDTAWSRRYRDGTGPVKHRQLPIARPTPGNSNRHCIKPGGNVRAKRSKA
jgi:hypothetical protein